MKHFFRIFLILVLLLAVSPVAFARVEHTGDVIQLFNEEEFYLEHYYSRVSKEYAYGIGGLPSDERCIKLNGDDVTGHGNWYTQAKVEPGTALQTTAAVLQTACSQWEYLWM